MERDGGNPRDGQEGIGRVVNGHWPHSAHMVRSLNMIINNSLTASSFYSRFVLVTTRVCLLFTFTFYCFFPVLLSPRTSLLMDFVIFPLLFLTNDGLTSNSLIAIGWPLPALVNR